MPRYLKFALIGLGAVVTLAIAVAAIIAATFDPNDYKPLVIKLVQEQKQRTLAIPGAIKLSFFPKIGANLGKASVSERGGPATFASIESARVSVALLPLLRRQVIVDHVKIDGIRVNVRRRKDGTTNFDDLLGTEDSKEQAPERRQIGFDIDGVSLTHANIVFEDQKAGQRFELADASIETGRVSDGARGELSFKGRVRANKPALDANVAVKSKYRLEISKQHYVLDGFTAEVSGKVADMSDMRAGVAGSVDAKLSPLDVALTNVVVSLNAKQAQGAMEAKLAAPALKATDKSVEAGRITVEASLPNPAGGSIRVSASGSAGARLDQETASADLSGKVDQSSFTAKVGVEKFSPMTYAFDVSLDPLDLDRYQAKPPAAAPAKGGQGGAEKPIDLSALKDLNAHGSLRIAALKAAGLSASNVRMDVRAAGGRIDVNPLAADLYQGKLSGSLAIVASEPPRISAKQTLSGVSIGPLLKDAIGKDPVEGRGNVTLEVAAQGATVPALKKGLNGSARLDLKDGAIRGINIAQAIRSAKAKLGGGGGSGAGAGKTEEKTDFSDLSASFKIANGVARNEDLSLKSPLLRLAGSGDIDLGQDRLDYVVKATVVASLQGQGGPEPDALKGLTVPVRLSGSFSQIGYKVEFGDMVSDKAKERIAERKDELRKDTEERLKDRLKGLLKR